MCKGRPGADDVLSGLGSGGEVSRLPPAVGQAKQCCMRCKGGIRFLAKSCQAIALLVLVRGVADQGCQTVAGDILCC